MSESQVTVDYTSGFSEKKMDSVNQFQILDKAACISFREKDENPSLHSAMSK